MPTDSSIVDDVFLGDLDEIRSIGGELGLRNYVVSVRIRTWSSGRQGLGIPTSITTQMVNAGGQPIMVRQVSRTEAIASGGLYTNRDLRVGPITPAYAAQFGLLAGGFVDSTIDPAQSVSPFPVDVQWIVTGTAIPTTGVVYDKIGEESTALHYYLILRATGRAP